MAGVGDCSLRTSGQSHQTEEDFGPHSTRRSIGQPAPGAVVAHVSQEQAVDPVPYPTVPQRATRRMFGISSLEIPVGEVVSGARACEIERPAGAADEWRRAEIGRPVEGSVDSDAAHACQLERRQRGAEDEALETCKARFGVRKSGSGTWKRKTQGHCCSRRERHSHPVESPGAILTGN